MKLQKQCSRQS